MRILIDARLYGLENSGIGRYLINLVREIAKQDSINNYSILLKDRYFNELNLPKNWTKIRADFGHYSFVEQFRLPQIIRSEKPDLIHFPHFNIPIFIKSKYVVTIHDMTMHKQGINATNQPLPVYLFKRLPYKFVFRSAVLNSKKVIVPTNVVKEEVVKYYKIDPKKIDVIYEGLDEKYIYGKKMSREMDVLVKYKLVNKNYFLYVGNAYPHKNLSSAVQAIVDVNLNKKTGCLFVIAGAKDKFIGRLEKIVSENRAENFVKIIGFVNDEDLKILYKNSSAFIYPSLSEGFGLQGLEAIASGTILACSSIPVFREVYDSHAFYFDPNDIQSISSTIYSVVSMKREDKFKYLTTAQEFIKKYSWREMAKETLVAYTEAYEESL